MREGKEEDEIKTESLWKEKKMKWWNNVEKFRKVTEIYVSTKNRRKVYKIKRSFKSERLREAQKPKVYAKGGIMKSGDYRVIVRGRRKWRGEKDARKSLEIEMLEQNRE